MTQVQVSGNQAQVRFNQFGLDGYELFLRAKKLPEHSIAYDWESDTYTIATPARYARLLGADAAAQERQKTELALHLFDYQRFIVARALEARRYAIYADCGLGKTAMLLEFGRHVVKLGKVLILSPGEIIPQTIEEALYGPAPLRGKPLEFSADGVRRTFFAWPYPQRVKRLNTRHELIEWLSDGESDIGITNYEKLIEGVIPELRHLAGLICDESSILKSGGGVIKWNLIKSANGIEYKLSCTATPAPNDIMEYASQAAFLEKLRHEGEILWTFFTRDKRGNWRIKPHAREGFYRFLASWSIYLRDPKNFGWADNLADVPEPVVFEHPIPMTPSQRKQAQALFVRTGAGLFGDKRMGVRERSKLSQLAKGFLYEGEAVGRVNSVKPKFIAELIEQEVGLGNQTLVWTVFDEEARILAKAIPHLRPAVIEGDTPIDERAEIREQFRTGKLPILISKASLLGFGLNFQNCGAMIFSGWDDSYERWYQAVKRAHRYGQTKALRVHVPFIPELEGMILENILRKKDNFERDAAMQERHYRAALAIEESYRRAPLASLERQQ